MKLTNILFLKKLFFFFHIIKLSILNITSIKIEEQKPLRREGGLGTIFTNVIKKFTQNTSQNKTLGPIEKNIAKKGKRFLNKLEYKMERIFNVLGFESKSNNPEINQAQKIKALNDLKEKIKNTPLIPVNRTDNITSKIKKIGNVLYITEFYLASFDEQTENQSLHESEYLLIEGKTMKNSDFIKSVETVSSNAITKLSKPFFSILEKIRALYPTKKMEIADLEIRRLRFLDIQNVTDIIIDWGNKIETENDYWFYYYIVANVVLRGKLIKAPVKNELKSNHSIKKTTEEITLPWKLGENDPIFIHYHKEKRLLPKGLDKFYDELYEKDLVYTKILDFMRNLTNFQLKQSYREIFDLPRIQNNKNLFTIKDEIVNSTNQDDYEKHVKINLNAKNFMDKRPGGKRIQYSDFEPGLNLNSELEYTPFYQSMKFFPKGIIHHIHWAAAFDQFAIYRAISQFIHKNKNDKNMITIIIKADVYLKDKTKPNSYLELSTPKFFIIEDFEVLINDYLINKKYEKETRDFQYNFKLSDGRCVIEPFSDVNLSDFPNDLKSFLFWRYCKDSILFNSEKIQDHELSVLFFKDHTTQPIENLNIFLKKNSHIIDKIITLVGQFLPNSYSDSLFNIDDRVSVAVWFKFEMIFGIYSELFENDNLFVFLTKLLYEDMFKNGVKGVEFRQGYDLDKKNSRMKIIQEIFYNNGVNSIPVSFIVPGRKLREGHKIDKILGIMDKAKKLNQDNVVGFDFFGYEDDPFTGARNFFPLSAKKIDINKNDNNNDFAKMLRSLKQGQKLYLHAGETSYFPNYPVNTPFLKKFYVNDNLIHSALMPNVKRLGHGFAVINNHLLMSIYRKKGISLEICPTSNQALFYYPVRKNPIVDLLRSGVSVTVSPDDPGLFGYSGVKMDWFNLVMNTDLKPSEYYMLIRNSFTSSSIKGLKINEELEETFEKIKKFFEYYELEKMQQIFALKEFNSKLKYLPEVYHIMLRKGEKLKEYLKALVKNNPYFNEKNDPELNIYDYKSILQLSKPKKIKLVDKIFLKQMGLRKKKNKLVEITKNLLE